MFGGGAGDLGAAFTQMGRMLSWEGGPVNWDLARDVARQTVAEAGDATVSRVERDEVDSALRLAELWLDEACAFPSHGPSPAAWSRAEWVEQTLPAWGALVDPIAGKVVDSLGSLLTSPEGPMGGQLGAIGIPPEQMQAMAAMAGPLQQMMRSLGGAMFGSQIGQAIGTLATEVVGSTDIGLPLAPAGRAALLPANVTAFGKDLGVPKDQVRLYLALREAATQRLFGSVPWLRSHLIDAVGAYARGIHVDTSRLEESLGAIDPMNPESMQQALTGGMFEPDDTPEQKAALARLETALALVEGWVDEVVDAAAAPHLPSAGALRETVRRRRAAGGPGEQTFASLVGLELRPRRLREAATLWRAVLDERGQDGREAVWAHPDLMPGAADLDDPAAYASGDGDAFDISALESTPTYDSGAREEPDESGSDRSDVGPDDPKQDDSSKGDA
jgi:putative hydrolase